MASDYPYNAKKGVVLAELEKLARQGKTVRYRELGEAVGIPARGPWKALLDEISRDQTAQGLPDITHLVVGADTRYPHQINFEDARPPSEAQKAEFERIMVSICDHYSATKS